MLERLPVHEHMVLPRLVRIDIEHILIRDARQDDLLCTVLGVEGERVPDAIFQRRQFCLLRFEPVGGLPPCDILLDLEQIVLGLPLAGELLGNALRVHIDLCPDVIPDSISALGLNEGEPFRGGKVARLRQLCRLCQHLMLPRRLGGHLRRSLQHPINPVKKLLTETVMVFRGIEVQAHKGGVLYRERRPVDGPQPLHRGGLPVIVAAGVPKRRVLQEGVRDDGEIPLVDVLRGGREAVSRRGEGDAAESGVVPLHIGILCVLRLAQIAATRHQFPDPPLHLGPAQADFRPLVGVADHQPLGAVLDIAVGAVRELPAVPAVRPMLVFQVLGTVCGGAVPGIEDGDAELVVVMAGAVAQETVDLVIGNGLLFFFGHSKRAGLFARPLLVDECDLLHLGGKHPLQRQLLISSATTISSACAFSAFMCRTQSICRVFLSGAGSAFSSPSMICSIRASAASCTSHRCGNSFPVRVRWL